MRCACTPPPCSPAVRCSVGLSRRLCPYRGQQLSCRTALRFDSRLVRLARPASPALPPLPPPSTGPSRLCFSPSLSLRLHHSSVLTAATTPLCPSAPCGTKGGHNTRGCARGHGRRLAREWWQGELLGHSLMPRAPQTSAEREREREREGEIERDREGRGDGSRLCAGAGGLDACCVALRARRVAMQLACCDSCATCRQCALCHSCNARLLVGRLQEARRGSAANGRHPHSTPILRCSRESALCRMPR